MNHHMFVLVTFIIWLQLLAVFMQLGARELLRHYMDLKQTNDVQLTFEALKVTVYLFNYTNIHTHIQLQAKLLFSSPKIFLKCSVLLWIHNSALLSELTHLSGEQYWSMWLSNVLCCALLILLTTNSILLMLSIRFRFGTVSCFGISEIFFYIQLNFRHIWYIVKE